MGADTPIVGSPPSRLDPGQPGDFKGRSPLPSKNRERLLRHRVSREFFDAVVRQATQLDLLSDDHFSVDGTLIEAAASLKSFRPKDEPPGDPPVGGNPSNRWVDFHGEKRSNATHQSTTDPDARLCRKGPGQEATL